MAVALLAQEPAAGRKFALIAGVRQYKGTGLGDLKYTENDAAALADLLRGDGYKRVVLLTRTEAKAKDDDDLFPTATNVLAQLKSLLEDAKAGDSVVVAMSGHGAQIRGRAGLFFCPEKCDLAKPETLVALDAVQAELATCKAGVKLLVVDACRNELEGKAVTVEGLKSASRPELPKPPGGTIALFSCSSGQRSYESERLKRGYLFHFLLEGLGGKAADERGEVTVGRLADYVGGEVPLAVKDEYGLSGRQTPQLLGDVAGRVVLRRTDRVSDVKPVPRDEASESVLPKAEKPADPNAVKLSPSRRAATRWV